MHDTPAPLNSFEREAFRKSTAAFEAEMSLLQELEIRDGWDTAPRTSELERFIDNKYLYTGGSRIVPIGHIAMRGDFPELPKE